MALNYVECAANQELEAGVLAGSRRTQLASWPLANQHSVTGRFHIAVLCQFKRVHAIMRNNNNNTGNNSLPNFVPIRFETTELYNTVACSSSFSCHCVKLTGLFFAAVLDCIK